MKPSTATDKAIIYVPGFMSTSQGDKSKFLFGHCQTKGYEYVAYDPEGLGESPAEEDKVEFKHWVEDAQAAVMEVKDKKVIEYVKYSPVSPFYNLEFKLNFDYRLNLAHVYTDYRLLFYIAKVSNLYV